MGVGYEQIGFSHIGSDGEEDPTYSLGNFNLKIEAIYLEYALKISLDVPSIGEILNWDQRLRILRKQDEAPTGPFDGEATLFLDEVYTEEGSHEYPDTDLAPGQVYYYSLYELRDDGVWIHDPEEGRVSAYPYSQWGFSRYMFESLPRGYKSMDREVGGDLQNFVSLFGAMLDGSKTDGDHLLTLFSAEDINEDLLPLLDRKIGWPTWKTTNGLNKRKQTLDAVALYKIRGIRAAYEQLLEEIFDWDLELVEGWRYAMFSNGKYGSTTPDMANIDEIRSKIGGKYDILKYVNDTIGWHGITGLGILLTEVVGVSDQIFADMTDRAVQMMEWGRASFVNYEFALQPSISEELILGASDDGSHEVEGWGFLTRGSEDEDAGATTDDAEMFHSTTASEVTTNSGYRTFSEELGYV